MKLFLKIRRLKFPIICLQWRAYLIGGVFLIVAHTG